MNHQTDKDTHVVKLPKLNDHIIAVKPQGKLVVEFYDIKLRKIVRKIAIRTDGTPWDEFEELNQELYLIEHGDDPNYIDANQSN